MNTTRKARVLMLFIILVFAIFASPPYSRIVRASTTRTDQPPVILTHFDFDTISSPQTAGTAFSITITARDQHDNIVTSYTGSNTLSDSTGTISPTSTGAFTSGSWTGSVTITTARTRVIITTKGEGKSGTSNPFDVNPASANKLVITVYPSSVTAGSWTSEYTVQRQDLYGNRATSGSTLVNLSSTSTGATKKFGQTRDGPPVTSVTIPDGKHSRDFYYYDEKAGSCTISVSAAGLTGDSRSLTVNPTSSSVETASGTGLVVFSPDAGVIESLAAVSELTLPSAGKPSLTFLHGFFIFRIGGLGVGETATVTVTLSSDLPTNASYWKYHAGEGGWIQIPMGSNDGDNVITITLVDGGLGDDDLTANGVIVDQGGPGYRPEPVGGILITVNKLALFSPWSVVIALVGCIATIVVVRKRRRRVPSRARLACNHDCVGFFSQKD